MLMLLTKDGCPISNLHGILFVKEKHKNIWNLLKQHLIKWLVKRKYQPINLTSINLCHKHMNKL